MARTARKVAPVVDVDPVSKHHANVALEKFRAAKGRALKLVAGEGTTRRAALESMRKLYEKLCETFLRAASETTYSAWCELVKPEWDELVAAAGDDALWDRLTETYERRAHAQ